MIVAVLSAGFIAFALGKLLTCPPEHILFWEGWTIGTCKAIVLCHVVAILLIKFAGIQFP